MEHRAPTIYHFAPQAVSADPAELTDGERQRAASFRFPADATHWTACRVSLRRILGRWLGLSPQDVPLIISPFGKPLLAPPYAEIHFNLSHAPDLALVALSPDSPLGIDLEPITRAPSLVGCETTFCHPQEIAGLPDDPTRGDELLRIWTAKEAYLKALGTGFSTAPESVRIHTRPDGTFASGPTPETRLLRLQDPVLNRHCAHLCVLQADVPLEMVGLTEMHTEAARSG